MGNKFPGRKTGLATPPSRSGLACGLAEIDEEQKWDRPGGLFECISMELSGSPAGYNAETGFCEPAQKPQSGEPYEHPTLYRIRRSQEKHQLLRQECRRKDDRRGQRGGDPRSASRMGAEADRGLAWGDGSDIIQRLDLRCAETVCCRIADGQSFHDESHRRSQEEKRSLRRAEDCRSGALQSAAGLLCGLSRDARTAAVAALPQPGGESGGADEESHEWPADGSGCGIQQAKAPRSEILQRVAGPVGRSADLGKRFVAAEPRGAGDLRGNAAAIAQPIAERAVAGETSEVTEEHRRGRRGDRADLGFGDLRRAALPFDRGCGELLRVDLGAECVGRQTATGADLQTTQRPPADGVDRGRETRAAVESAVGRTPRAGIAKWSSQPCELGSGTEVGGLPVGGRQIRQTIRGPESAGTGNRGGNESGLKQSELTSGKGNLPAGAARRQQPGARTVLAVK